MMNIQSTKHKRVWHSGPPPFPGWWNASAARLKDTWRWWDGERWSAYALENDGSSIVYASSQVVVFDREVEWNDYWPEDAVCPRLNPDHSSTIWKGKVWAWIDGELTSTSMGAEDPKASRVWHSGPPPHIGWWNASTTKTENLWRWWDGEYWSVVVREGDPLNTVAYYGGIADQLPGDLMWNDYWPEDAVCPRLNPIHSSTIWKGKVWAWLDGELVSQPDPLPRQMEEFHRFGQDLPELKTVVCPNHKFVDVEKIKCELHEVVTAAAIAMGRMERIVNTVQSIRQQIGGA